MEMMGARGCTDYAHSLRHCVFLGEPQQSEERGQGHGYLKLEGSIEKRLLSDLMSAIRGRDTRS